MKKINMICGAGQRKDAHNVIHDVSSLTTGVWKYLDVVLVGYARSPGIR
jgi:hypothetical protein